MLSPADFTEAADFIRTCGEAELDEEAWPEVFELPPACRAAAA